jgi:hypothetical protein
MYPGSREKFGVVDKICYCLDPCRSGYTGLMCIPDGRVVRLSEKLVSSYRAEFTRYRRAIVKCALASSL